MNPSKWKALLNIQEVHDECHPGLAKAYIDLFAIHIPPPKKILELGGCILEFEMLKNCGYDVTGVTIRPWQAMTVSPTEGKIYRMDMHDLKFKPESFDAIFSAVTLEMAVGAGEFEKIIGTQEMGVTQLMKAVKDVTGVAKLNTMALGGLQEQVLTTQGVGTQVTGRYGAGGIEFIGTQQQEARNTRIYRYGEARAQTEAIIRGQVAGKKSAMGTGAVPGVEKYVGPGREGNIEEQTYDGSYQGTYNAMVDVFSGRGKGAMAQKKWAITTGREFSKSVMGVNTGVAGGAGVPGAEISSRIEARPENINPATYRYMGGRPAPAPAKNVDVYGVPGRKLPPPTGFVARTVKNWGVSANKTKDIQTAYKEGGEKGALLAAEMAKIEESRFGPKGVGALKNILHSTKRNFVMQENRILKEKRKIYSEFENLASKFEKSRVEQEYQTMFSRGRRKFGYGTLVKKWLDRKFGIDLEESKEPSLVGRKQTYKETREKLLKLRQQEGELRQDLEKSEKEYKKAEEWSKISTKPHKEFFRAQDEKIKAEEAMAKRDREDAEEYDLIQGYYKGIGYKDRDTARRAKDKERVREERREFSYLLKESERALEKYDKEERERVMGVRTPANKVYALDRKESDSKINKIMAKEIEDAQAQAQAGMAVIDVRKTKGYTSAAEERGEIASPAVQREYMANRGAIQTVFGSAEDTGLGSAVITVNLAPGLMARVDEAHGVSVDVRQAANQTV